MIREAIATGNSVDEAKKLAFEQLNVSEDATVEYEVLDYQIKKTFGLFGGKPAKVRAYIKESETENTAQFLKAVLEKMGIQNVSVKAEEFEGGACFNIDGDDIGSIIGRRGETLDAIQYLTSLAVNRKDSDYYRVVLNIGNYREKREKTLQGLARKIANSALKTGRNTTLEPMSPYERRIIHTTVQEINGVTSWSVGEEPNRCVIIGSEKKFRNNGHKDFNKSRNHNKDFRSKSNAVKPKENAGSKKIDSDAPLYGRIDMK